MIKLFGKRIYVNSGSFENTNNVYAFK